MTTLDTLPPQPGTMEAVAKVKNLTVTFRRGGLASRAIRGVSLEIRRGEIVGLVGESGSGKSVLGQSLLGLLPADPAPATEGPVTVCGKDTLHGEQRQRAERAERDLDAARAELAPIRKQAKTAGAPAASRRRKSGTQPSEPG